MFGRARDWIKAHPRWSIVIAIGVALILFAILRPTPRN